MVVGPQGTCWLDEATGREQNTSAFRDGPVVVGAWFPMKRSEPHGFATGVGLPSFRGIRGGKMLVPLVGSG